MQDYDVVNVMIRKWLDQNDDVLNKLGWLPDGKGDIKYRTIVEAVVGWNCFGM